MSAQNPRLRNSENKNTLPEEVLPYQQRIEHYTTCQVEECEEEGDLYTDKLIPVRLCSKHRNIRHGNKGANPGA